MNDAADKILRAARATLQGAAEVTLDLSYDVPSAAGSGRMAGRVDFVGDRCLLVGDVETLVFDGGDEYRLFEGRWHLRPRAPGTRSMIDPAWLLGLLAVEPGVHRAREEPDGEIRGDLDTGLAARTVRGGLWPGWELRIGVGLAGEEIRRMRLEDVDSESRAVGVTEAFELRQVSAIDPIELPSPDCVVTLPDLPDEIGGD
jgi:hypothetical protein